MSTKIDDITKIINKPRTNQEWLDRFNSEDRAVVEKAILSSNNLRHLWDVLRELEDNPYPMSSYTIYSLKKLIVDNQKA